MPGAYERHDTVLRAAVFAHGGVVYKTVGDAFQIAFPDAARALAAALDAQRALQAEPWPLPEPLRVRMALHTGAVDPTPEGDYRSPVLNRLGRLLGAAHGEQVLISQATMELARDHLPAGASMTDLGEQRLKDLYRPERVWQLAHAELRTTFPALRTLDAQPNNLPSQPTQLIGREDDARAVRAMLGRDEIRLVTLTGPGGMGKTRLSLQVGADVLDRFHDGVWFVPLDALTDPALVPAAVAQVFGLPEADDGDVAATVTGYLRGRQVLLILDNLEQVIGAASFIGELLVAAPGVKVLATSRTRLQLRSEHEYPVGPLRLPDDAIPGDPATLSQFESVRLFIDRAVAVKPAFAVTASNAPAIAEICTRLDGLPLAIELAAARVKMLPPEAMLRRLENRLPLLTGGARDLPARQQTLRGAIAWSYELLSPEDQALFRRLAVFAGGAGFDAIDAVVADAGQGWVIFDGIERLVDHSLLRQEEEAGEPRFSMFETIREYGLERLAEAGESDEARRRQAGWVVDLLSTFRLDMTGQEVAEWLDRVDTEQGNLRAALGWAIENDPAVAIRIAGFAGRFWQWRGHLREGHDWFGRSLAVDSAAVPAEDRARALRVGSVFTEAMGEFDTALAHLRQAVELYTALGARPDAAFARSVVGIVTAECHGYEAAKPILAEGIDMARLAGDRIVLAICLNNLGAHAMDAGDLQLSRATLSEAFEIVREESGIYAATVLSSYADVMRLEDDFAGSTAL
jgi:predicted ATPase